MDTMGLFEFFQKKYPRCKLVEILVAFSICADATRTGEIFRNASRLILWMLSPIFGAGCWASPLTLQFSPLAAEMIFICKGSISQLKAILSNRNVLL